MTRPMSQSSSPSPEPPLTHRLTGRTRLGARLGSFHFSAVELLITLVILLISAPFVAEFKQGEVIDAVLITALLVASVLAVGGSRRTFLRMSLLAGPALLFKWLHQLRPDLVSPGWFLAVALCFCSLVVWELLRFALRATRVNNEVLCASIAAYLMLGLIFAFGYMLTANLNPQAFAFTVPGAGKPVMNGQTAFYYSYVTLSTVGYGDIVPVSPLARTMSMTEAITGLLYTAVLIARLVALQTSNAVAAPDRNVDSDET